MIGGAKFFSESGGDCQYDPVLLPDEKGNGTVYTCCNTVFNKGMRWVGPGGMMFCEMADDRPGVRTCLNGGSTLTDSAFKQDEWGECQATDNMWCPGVVLPDDENGVMWVPTLDGLQSKIAQQQASKIQGQSQQPALSEEDLKNVKICWGWACNAEMGYVRSGNRCVLGDGVTPTDPATLAGQYDAIIKRVQQQRNYLIQTCGLAAK